MAANRKKKIILGTRVPTQVASPTGKPSRVNPAMARFQTGQSTAGKRPLSAQPVAPAPQRGNVFDAIRDKNRRTEEETGLVKKRKRRMR